ncbi:MAG: ester cyclase [Rubrobacteraceae bacterium]
METKTREAHSTTKEGGKSMSTEENKATSRRFYEELFENGNLDAAEEIVAPDFVLHDPNLPEEVRGIEGLKQFVSLYRTAFPDIRFEIEKQIAEGDSVGTRWTARGTHEGELMGIAPTGNKVEVGAFTLHRFSGAKISEDWAHYDAMGMMRQLGAIPAET